MQTAELTDEVRARRIAVAKDVKERLQLEKLLIYRGAYLANIEEFIGDLEERSEGSTDNLNAQPFVDQIERECRVCARGALLISHIRLHNKVQLGDLWDADGSDINAELLADTFDMASLSLIECAFMQDDGFLVGDDHSSAYSAVQLGNLYANQHVRLDKIMDNIIANNGEFIP